MNITRREALATIGATGLGLAAVPVLAKTQPMFFTDDLRRPQSALLTLCLGDVRASFYEKDYSNSEVVADCLEKVLEEGLAGHNGGVKAKMLEEPLSEHSVAPPETTFFSLYPVPKPKTLRLYVVGKRLLDPMAALCLSWLENPDKDLIICGGQGWNRIMKGTILDMSTSGCDHQGTVFASHAKMIAWEIGQHEFLCNLYLA